MNFRINPGPVRLTLLVPLVILLVSCSAGDDGGPSAPASPGDALEVNDLTATAGSIASVTLTWTVPATEKADWTMRYDLRYLVLGEEEAAWDNWTVADTPTSGNTAGTTASHSVTGLDTAETYVFKLRCSTDGVAWSAESNPVVATAGEVFDTTAPGPVTDLVFWSSTGTSVTLTWSPGHDDAGYGIATGYEVRYATSTVTDATWAAAIPSSAAIVAAANPAFRQTTISGLQSDQNYYFAVKAIDEMDQESTVSNQVQARTVRRATIYIKPDGTGDQPTIEAGVYAAQPGDRILVAAGHYTWSNQNTGDVEHGLIWIQRDMTGWELVSEDGPAATTLDGQNQGGVIFIQGYNDITIEGFTITGGVALDDPEVDPGGRYGGAGITSHLNNARIVNCIITGNRSIQGGGVWHGGQGEFTMIDCVVTNNEAEMGGGIFLINSLPRIILSNCIIRDNTASSVGGGLMAYNVTVTVEGCILADNSAVNRGGAAYLGGLNENSLLDHTTIVGNQAPVASALRLAGRDNVHPADPYFLPHLQNCVVAFNTTGAAFEVVDDGGLANVGCNLVFGNPGGDDFPPLHTDDGGNLNLDPAFCSLTTLAPGPDSPCLPENHPDGTGCGLLGAVGSGNCQ